MIPINHNDYTAKIHKLKNGRVILKVIDHQNNTEKTREFRSEGEMVRRVRQDIVDGAYEPEFYAIVDENDNILNCE